MGDQCTTDSDFVQSILAEALRLAALGYRVHPVHGIRSDKLCTCGNGPVCKSPGKHPVLPGWETQASSDPAVINSWDWGQGYNLGLVPGEQLCILDFDGEEGVALFQKMVAWDKSLLSKQYGLFKTGSGGLHLIGGGKAKSFVKRLPGLDIRGAGGQAVVPPSKHFSGNFYRAVIPLTAMVPSFSDDVLRVANGKYLPPELETPDIVTIDDLKGLSKRQGKYQSSFKALVKGEVFAEPGTRDDILTGMVGTIVRRWPNLVPSQVAQHFKASLEAMAGQPEPPTVEDVEEKLERFAYQQREKQDSGLPQIFIGPDIAEMAERGVEALAKSTNNFYRRGGKLSFVNYNPKLPDLCARKEESPTILVASSTYTRGILSRVCRFMRRNKDGDLVAKTPPSEVAVFINDVGEWPQIPLLEGVVSGPFLRGDGTIFSGDGYDELTGLLSIGHKMTGGPTPLGQALEELLEVFIDFPFKEGHYSVLLAAVLTGAGRFAFKGPSPLFLIDANTRAAGKTLLANVASNIAALGGATGIGVGADNEEDRKAITSAAMDGAQIILIDNIEGKFGTSKLCEALSLPDGVWSDRVLGKNTVWKGAFRPLWFATGNNVLMRADMARRTCYCRLESPMEKPEERTGFKIPSLMGYVSEHRDRLFIAALSILKHYFDAGRPLPKDMKPWGGFEGWSDLIRGAVIWCGYPDPFYTRTELSMSDEDHGYGQAIVTGLQSLIQEQGKPLKCSEVVSILYRVGQSEADLAEYADLRESIEALCPRSRSNPTPQSVGKVFKRYRGRVFGGYALQRCGAGGREWCVMAMGG